MAKVIAPKRGEQFVDPKTGVPLPRPMSWIEQSSLILNSNFDSIFNRLDKLEPQYVTKGNADSPYSAVNMDYVTADMSTGDLTVVLPSTGRVWVTRDGVSNTLTLQGTVSGTVNPTILFDNTTVALFHNGTEWRYA